MGCGGSKLEEQPAVILCKQRCNFLGEAVRFRLLFAESQLAYAHSLSTIGQSFHFLMLEPHDSAASNLAVPTGLKGADVNSAKKHVTFNSRSNSGSHLHFHTESDSDSDVSHFHLHDHGDSSPSRMHQGANSFGVPSTFLHMNYMKSSRATSSVVYEQKPVTSESVFYFGPGEAIANPYPESYPYPYSGYSNYHESVSGGYYGYTGSVPPAGIASTSSSKPPPSPPRASGWDFFNLFDSASMYYGASANKSSSMSSKDAREEEGIPDLEDVEESSHQYRDRRNAYFHNEVVKEALPKQHGSSNPSELSTEAMMDSGKESPPSLHEESISDVSTDSNSGDGEAPVEYEVHMMDMKVGGGGSDERSNKARPRGPLSLPQVVSEIKSQFDKAHASVSDVLLQLEPNEQSHLPQRPGIKGKRFVSSLPSISKAAGNASSSNEKTRQVLLEIDEELAVRSKNLATTLHKLSLWEKKLHFEVKAEEKLRVAHEKNCKKLKRMDEKGSEVHKIDATRILIKSLSTKMRMAIQIVDKISIAINRIRDEELWPQIYEFIQRLNKMWKSMLECHHIQREVIQEASNLGSLGKTMQASEAYVEALQGLVEWASAFSSWISSQKGFVSSLNNWLMKCLLYEPEETADGVVPFSPGRIGAPIVFVICNQWAQSLERISEKEVIEAICLFTVGLLRLCEHRVNDSHPSVITNKDLERKARSLQREDLKISKQITGLEKQIIRLANNYNINSVTEENDLPSVQASVLRVFEAVESFMSDSLTVYEELIQRSQEARQR